MSARHFTRMGGILAWIWEKRWRTHTLALVLALLIACVAGTVNWWRFYDHRSSDVSREGKFLVSTVRSLAYATNADLDGDSALRAQLDSLLGKPTPYELRRKQIIVERYDASEVLWRWRQSEKELDRGRDVDSVAIAFADRNGPLAGLRITYREAVRPNLIHALVRGWTLSIPDLVRDGWDSWWKGELFDRSFPIYSVFLPALLLVPVLTRYRKLRLEQERIEHELREAEALAELSPHELTAAKDSLVSTEYDLAAARSLLDSAATQEQVDKETIASLRAALAMPARTEAEQTTKTSALTAAARFSDNRRIEDVIRFLLPRLEIDSQAIRNALNRSHSSNVFLALRQLDLSDSTSDVTRKWIGREDKRGWRESDFKIGQDSTGRIYWRVNDGRIHVGAIGDKNSQARDIDRLPR